jgi:uncharacterized protein YjbI with pentapeptide repeats
VLIGSGLIGIGVAVAIVWPITDLIAAHDIGAIAGAQRERQLKTAREAVRTQLLTLGAGVFAAGALIFTARNSIFAQRTVQLTEQGQVTDRYTKAIEQLGSEKLDVRIGGIYALERVAVMEVLTAFIREHSCERGVTPEPADVTIERTTRPDVQAAVTVIVRRDRRNDRGRIHLGQANLSGAHLNDADLSDADLIGLDLTAAHLSEAILTGAWLKHAHLNDAILTRADLTDADLSGANLSGANLTDAKLAGADFYDANLTEAWLADANLRDADLTDADLTNAKLSRVDFTRGKLTDSILSGANLSGANLTGANLTRANLRYANLTDARLTDADLTDADLTGAWREQAATPDGWTREADSGRLQRVVAEPGAAT